MSGDARADASFETSHTHFWETATLARILLDEGWHVDGISWTNQGFLPNKDYDVFIDVRLNLERLQPMLAQQSRPTLSILHADTAHWTTNNPNQEARQELLTKRRGVVLERHKLLPENRAAEHADHLTYLGNDFTRASYDFAQLPASRIPVSVPFTYAPLQRDWSQIKNRFLWFGSGGLVHKGLDLVLEAFAARPDLYLTVCGPIQERARLRSAVRPRALPLAEHRDPRLGLDRTGGLRASGGHACGAHLPLVQRRRRLERAHLHARRPHSDPDARNECRPHPRTRHPDRRRQRWLDRTRRRHLFGARRTKRVRTRSPVGLGARLGPGEPHPRRLRARVPSVREASSGAPRRSAKRRGRERSTMTRPNDVSPASDRAAEKPNREQFDLIVLSPHLDDAAFSCGALLHRAHREGLRTLVVNFFTAVPEPDRALSDFARELHASWGVDERAVETRRLEDQAALARLGAEYRNEDLLDGLYRQHEGSGDRKPTSTYPDWAGLARLGPPQATNRSKTTSPAESSNSGASCSVPIPASRPMSEHPLRG